MVHGKMDMWCFGSKLRHIQIFGNFYRQVPESDRWLGKNVKAMWANVDRPCCAIHQVGYRGKMWLQDKMFLPWSFSVCIKHVCISVQNYLTVLIELFLILSHVSKWERTLTVCTWPERMWLYQFHIRRMTTRHSCSRSLDCLHVLQAHMTVPVP